MSTTAIHTSSIQQLAAEHAQLMLQARPVRLQLIRMTALAHKQATRQVNELLTEMEKMIVLKLTNNADFDDVLDLLETHLQIQ